MSNEQDLPNLPPISTEPSQKPRISRIKFLRRIVAPITFKYEAILGRLGEAPQMPGEILTSKETTKYTGDIGETLEVDSPVPEWWTNIKRPIKIGNGLFLPRVERQEVIAVVDPESDTSPAALLEKFSKPQIPQSNTFNPPYPPQWQVVEGDVDALPENNNVLQFPQPKTQATENPASHLPSSNASELENNHFLKAPANLKPAA